MGYIGQLQWPCRFDGRGVLIQAGLNVDLYEAMPSVERKFLMAGKGGMNITHSESFDIEIVLVAYRKRLYKTGIQQYDFMT